MAVGDAIVSAVISVIIQIAILLVVDVLWLTRWDNKMVRSLPSLLLSLSPLLPLRSHSLCLLGFPASHALEAVVECTQVARHRLHVCADSWRRAVLQRIF